jgi:ankyrin repeat protein
MKYIMSFFVILIAACPVFSADPVFPQDLIQAVYSGNLPLIQKAVAANPSIVQMKNQDGQTLFFLASSLGKLDIVQYLLDSGADIEAKDKMGRTPLITAARERGGIDVIKLLVEKGAAVNAVDDGGDSALALAAWRGFEDIVDYLLEKGANVPINDELGRWLLGEAADKGLEKLFTAMTAKGADLSIKVEDNATLLHMACGGGSSQIIETLLKSKLDVNFKDDNGWTPMHYASFKGKTDIIGLLVEQGADINARNLIGETPMNIAVSWGTKETVDFLKTLEADDSPTKFPKLTGEYMGMAKPGDKPEPFGKGMVINHFKPHSSIVFSPDGKEAFWSIMIPPQGKGYGSGALMHSKMIGDTWTYPVPMKFEKTGIRMDVPFFSYDGSKLYFIARAAVKDGDISGKERIWVSERQGDSWAEPKTLDEKVNSFPVHWQFSFDRKGNLYFAEWRKMYFSEFSNGEFKVPVDLHKALGKEKLEGDAPFIAPDGSYLIYSASGPGKPTLDLVIMFKKKDGTWTDPVDMGNGINTPGHELCPIVTNDGKYLFYTSNFEFYWAKADIIEQLRKSILKE